MISYWTYILIGNDKTGKTTFQKYLVSYLTGQTVNRLNRNTSFKINQRNAPIKMNWLFTINRSYQENKIQYKSVENYFNQFFKEEDICILSSHSNTACISEIEKMIIECKKRFYNVGGVFFSNCINPDVRNISLLGWDERFYLYNHELEHGNKKIIYDQIDKLAQEFGELLIRRAYNQ